MTDAGSPLLIRHRVRAWEIPFWVLAVGVIYAFPGYLSLATTAAIMGLFVVSLDLLVGFAGIITVGHALYFGIGAYTAGLAAVAGLQEPITGVILAAVSAAVVASIIGPFLLRFRGLPLIMVTLALGQIGYETANKASTITGGDNGLDGIALAPVLGVFPWSVYGFTSYLYTLAWVFVLFVAVRRLVASPFGMALQGIRENPSRMLLIGAPVLRHLVWAYVASAFVAGAAGALSAQTEKFVGLEVLGLNLSVDALVMLILGGVGRLYGGLIGAPVYMVVRHLAAEWNPYHWMAVVGLLLILVMRFSRGGLLGMLESVQNAIVSRFEGPR